MSIRSLLSAFKFIRSLLSCYSYRWCIGEALSPSPLSPFLTWEILLLRQVLTSPPDPHSTYKWEICNKQRNQQHTGNMDGCPQHSQVWSLPQSHSCSSCFLSSNFLSPPLHILWSNNTKLKVLRMVMMKRDMELRDGLCSWGCNCPTVEGIYQHLFLSSPSSMLINTPIEHPPRAHPQQHTSSLFPYKCSFLL